jgi:hypothetical protein
VIKHDLIFEINWNSWILELEPLSSISYITVQSFAYNINILSCITWIAVALQCITWITAALLELSLNCGCITWIAVELQWIAMLFCISVQHYWPLVQKIGIFFKCRFLKRLKNAISQTFSRKRALLVTFLLWKENI